MALFNKKSDEPKAKSAPAAAADGGDKKRGLKFGKKKDAAPDAVAPATTQAAPGTEDFSDFSEDTLAAPANGATDAADGKGKKGKKRGADGAAKPKVAKSGTLVGLNIGNESIKAVEVTAKGGELTVTALGQVPTPSESIANGVVMSVGALSHAIRDLFKQAGIKSKNVVFSVAGTGSLVVRVIEVPKMTDKELVENMSVDADRYIPFPPSEVVMDFKALRDLPADPDSPNMEVLLAAAQREVIDLHIKVIEDAKMSPQAIDVEPLAAARAISVANKGGQAGTVDSSANGGATDYYDVSAVINMGATGSEVSVLRGDILVFTRLVPLGGNALTQALIDNLALPWHDAERLKRELGDALPPQTGDMGAAYGAAGTFDSAQDVSDDWSDFGVFDAESAPATAPSTFTAATTAPPSDTETILDFEPTPPSAQSQTSTGQATTGDPFDLDFFNQGPQNDEPKERHGQKEPDDGAAGKAASPFDFSSFDFADEPATPAAASAPAPAPTPDPVPAPEPESEQPAASGGGAFDFGFSLPDDDAAPAAQPAPAVTPAEPTQAAPAATAFSFDLPDEPAPALAAPAALSLDEPPAPASPPAQAAPAPDEFSFDLPDEAAPQAVAPDSLSQELEITEAQPSAYDFGEVAEPHTPTTAVSLDETLAPAPVAAGGSTAAGDDEFDLDTLFGDEPTGTAPVAAAPAASGSAADDLGIGDFSASFDNFGAGLSDTDPSATVGIDAATVHAILRPLLDELVNEVRRSLEYHASRYPDAAVHRIILVGGGAQLKNIDSFCTQSLGIPCTTVNPVTRLALRAPKLPTGYAEENGPVFAVALGLAIRDFV